MRTVIAITGWGHGASSLNWLSAELSGWCTVYEAAPAELFERGASGGDEEPISRFALGLADLVSEQKPHGIVGWSMGAIIALEHLTSTKSSGHRTVLVGGTARFSTDPKSNYHSGIPEKEIRALERSFLASPSDTLAGFYRFMSQGKITTEEVTRRLSVALRTESEIHRAGLEYLRTVDLRKRLNRSKTPLLLIHGGTDHLIPPGAAHVVVGKVPTAELLLVEGAGHDLALASANSRKQAIVKLSAFLCAEEAGPA